MDSYSVYCHNFPNGKTYIGITKNPKRRFAADGKGYITNEEMYQDIKKYGWINVEHKILQDNLTRQEAQKLEKEYIAKFNSINNGYNKSTGGGGVNHSYYSSAVMKILDTMQREGRRLPDPVGPSLMGMYNVFEGMSSDELACAQINLLEVLMRENKNVYQYEADDEMFCIHWVRTIYAHLTKGVDVRTYKFDPFDLITKET